MVLGILSFVLVVLLVAFALARAAGKASRHEEMVELCGGRAPRSLAPWRRP